MKSTSELDSELGMEAFAGESPPCSARVRGSEEDFRVEEVVSLESLAPGPRPGWYPVYRVEKRSVDTMHMERELSKALGSRVSYGGLKDKRAVAVQYVTPTSRGSSWPPRITRPGFTADLLGYIPSPISRGSVLGNRFSITLRECCPRVTEAAGGALKLAELKRLPNFFGYQRFGVFGTGTHRIGRAIVQRRFSEAIDLMLRPKRQVSGEAIEGGHTPSEYEFLHPEQDVERAVARRMAEDPGDAIGALRGLPVKMRKFYVQAYQSLIFNRVMSLALDAGIDISGAQSGDNWGRLTPNGVVPLEIGSSKEDPPEGAAPMVQLAGYAFRNYGSRFDALTSRVMLEEEVSAKDFYIKEMQEASAEGGFRIAHLVMTEPRFELSDSTALLGFRLARGQYATVLLREIVKPANPRESGLA